MKAHKTCLILCLSIYAIQMDAHATPVPTPPVFLAEIIHIEGGPLTSCRSLRQTQNRTEQLLRQLHTRILEFNSRPRTDRLIQDLEDIQAELIEIDPSKFTSPNLTVTFSVQIPTLYWMLDRSLLNPSAARLNELIYVDQILAPPSSDPIQFIPRQAEGGNNYFIGPKKRIEYSFRVTTSLYDLCEVQEPIRLPVRHRMVEYYDEKRIHAERSAVIEANYARVDQVIREKL